MQQELTTSNKELEQLRNTTKDQKKEISRMKTSFESEKQERARLQTELQKTQDETALARDSEKVRVVYMHACVVFLPLLIMYNHTAFNPL